MAIQRIAILGGGTAGWLAANHLGLALKAEAGYEITLIESPDVPIIGVGEGTVPHIRNTLSRFGISEAEFIDTCDVTFKQGIKFVNWMSETAQGKNNFYYHPFDSAFMQGENWVNPWLHSRNTSASFNAEKYTDFMGVQSALCENYKCPKLISSPPYEGPLSYAYHLNAAKFAQLLAKNARNKFGVKHQLATVISCRRNEQGSIVALTTAQGEDLCFDFYIDCSGFHSVLIDKVLGVPLVDKSHQILSNSALAIQVPSQEAKLPPYTIATAHKAGWIWDIALTERRGVGFVYSDQHMSESDALGAFSKYLGVDAESFSPRKVPMKIGYRKTFWANNCVALGLAQGFVEPLEATSILITDYAAEFLAKGFPKTEVQMPALANRFNQLFTYVWERVIDFVQLHYYLSDRRDSSFWVDNTEGAKLSDELINRLDLWKFQVPERQDFFSKFEVFDIDNYLYILYGMHFPTACGLVSHNSDAVNQLRLQREQKHKQLLAALPGHRDYIEGLKRALRAAS